MSLSDLCAFWDATDAQTRRNRLSEEDRLDLLMSSAEVARGLGFVLGQGPDVITACRATVPRVVTRLDEVRGVPRVRLAELTLAALPEELTKRPLVPQRRLRLIHGWRR